MEGHMHPNTVLGSGDISRSYHQSLHQTHTTSGDREPYNSADAHPNSDNDEIFAPRPDPRVRQIRNLSTLDVAALISNKMIGTGIFTGPSLVLQQTLNKNMAIGFWVLGLVYTVLSMLLYIEYARKLPFTGGELVYMDDAMPKPRLLAYTLYAFYFVFLYTSCANCLNFAYFVLAAADSSYFTYEALNNTQRLVRFVAVVAITGVCMLLYISNAKSKLVNKATAATKIIFLIGALLAGAAYIGKQRAAGNLSGAHSQWSQTALPGSSSPSWPKALITVLFSYHGWENATLVAGEVDSFKVLRRGFLLAVFTVGALYISMAILLCAAFDWKGPGSSMDIPTVPLSIFLGGTEDNQGSGATAAAILIALSALGSMLSVSYTSVRVKQSIGWTNILPWSQIWRRQGPLRAHYSWQYNSNGGRELAYTFNERLFNRPGTPKGGIILHWSVTVLYICFTAGYDQIRDGIQFASQILVYGHFIAEAAVAVLFMKIGSLGFDPTDVTYFPAWNWHADQKADAQAGNPPRWLRPKPVPWIGPLLLGGSVVVFSFIIIVAACFEREGRVLLYVMIGILGSGLLYWFLFVRYESASKVFQWFGFRLETRMHGVDDKDDADRVCDWCSVVGASHRHPAESYEAYNAVSLASDGIGPRLLSSIFGGSEQQRTGRLGHDLWQAIWSCFGSRQERERPVELHNTL